MPVTSGLLRMPRSHDTGIVGAHLRVNNGNEASFASTLHNSQVRFDRRNDLKHLPGSGRSNLQKTFNGESPREAHEHVELIAFPLGRRQPIEFRAPARADIDSKIPVSSPQVTDFE